MDTWDIPTQTTVKTSKPCRFTISFELCPFCHEGLKKELKYESVCYVIPLNYRLTGHSENFKIKLHNFQERLSLRHNTTLKLLCLFHICFQRNNNLQRDLLFKEHSQRLSISFSIWSIIVSVISYSHIWNKIRRSVWQHTVLGKMFFKQQSYIFGLGDLTHSII